MKMNKISVLNKDGDWIDYSREELLAKLVADFKESGSGDEEINDLISCSNEELAEVYEFFGIE